MPYTDYFRQTDKLIEHLDGIFIPSINPFIMHNYIGFIAVSSVTVLELAMKKIFIDFSRTKHKILLNFCDKYFEHINGRIKLRNIQEEYLPKFGDKYKTRFEKRLQKLENYEFITNKKSIKASYGNIIEWRHAFVHQGKILENASYDEVKSGYNYGKVIMQCLDDCMHR
jgi:hypothetical protein